ncbi:hypothetical protein OTSKARP_0176 [Orientia tsutsugamushi str. Karp]|nr:hypothetical protein OTSKARP_0176 [Orientia tsutsugamushi str. Karp]
MRFEYRKKQQWCVYISLGTQQAVLIKELKHAQFVVMDNAELYKSKKPKS